MLRFNRLAIAVVLAVAFGSLGMIADASVPDSNGVIHGCYNASGLLRVIDSSTAACRQDETALTWNQTGLPGPAGPQGPAGFTNYNQKGTTGNPCGVAASCSGVQTLIETCDPGDRVISGGYSIADSSVVVLQSQAYQGDAWMVQVLDPNNVLVGVSVICATVR